MHLQAKGLRCSRGYHTLFKDLDFSLTAGQLLLVEGRNGCGKTTLLKTISGLRTADAGQVLWNQQPIQDCAAGYRQQFVWLGHTNGIKEDLTALENLQMMHTQTLYPTKLPFKALLEKLGLKGNAHRFPRHFSAGMKRRLGLARLLLSSAPLWILDEPQAALDKTGIRLFESLLSEHLQQGGSALMTSHHTVQLPTEHSIQRLDLTA